MAILNRHFQLCKFQYLNLLDFALASRMDPFLIATVLTNVQILMACQVLIIVGSPGRNMPLNGQKESLNQNEMDRVKEMSTVVAFC
jgi:hypothetical protein